MGAGRNVAAIDPLHSASAQGVELLEAVYVMCRQPSVDLNLHRIETQRLAVRQRHKHGEVSVGRIEQLLFQLVELRRDAQDVGFDLLDLLVQTFHLRPSALVRRTRPCADAQQSAHHDQEMLAHLLLSCRFRVGSHLMKLRWQGLEGRIGPAHQARSARASTGCQMPVRRPRDEGAAPRTQPRDAPQACGSPRSNRMQA